MAGVNTLFVLIILGSVALIVAGALLPTGLITYSDGIELANLNDNVTESGIVMFELVPLGLAIAFFLAIFAIIGLKITGKFGG